MPQFEINYAQGVPSVVSMPRANMNVDTGAGDIGRAVSGFGGAMFEVGQKIQMAQDAMDLSILNQTGEKMDLDAELALSKITDAEEQAKFIQKHEADRANLSSKSNNRIQNAYQINYNNTSGDRLRRMTSVGMQTRAKDAQDKFKFARQTAVDNGNLLEVHKIDNLALATENIGPEQYKVLTDSAPVDIAFARAGKFLATNPIKTEEMMSDPNFLETLNTDQTKQALNLQNDARISMRKNKVDSQMQYDIAIGNNAKTLSSLMQEKRLTLEDIDTNFNTLMNSPMIPPENVKDLNTERTRWKSILSDSLKQVDTIYHKPQTVVQYQNEARLLMDVNEQNQLLGKISSSEASGEIYKDEADSIRDSLATQLDSNVSAHISALNTETHSAIVSTVQEQQKWIDNQFSIAVSSGQKVTKDYYSELVDRYSKLLDAKKWASTQAVEEFNGYLKSTPNASYDDRIAASIAIRSDWKNKEDKVLVEAYKKYTTEQSARANKYRLKK
jgi:hypothetical protein